MILVDANLAILVRPLSPDQALSFVEEWIEHHSRGDRLTRRARDVLRQIAETLDRQDLLGHLETLLR